MSDKTLRIAASLGTGSKSTVAERRRLVAAQCEARRQQQWRRRFVMVFAGGLFLALVAFVVLQRLLDDNIGTPVAIQGRTHVEVGMPLAFEHYPPSSGNHYTDPQPSGIYTEEIPEGAWIHSLEHGYIVVLVKCPDGCLDTFFALAELSRDLPPSMFGTVKFIVTPYSHPFSDPRAEAPLTLLAWGRERMLQRLDRDTIIQFYKTYVDRGPEPVP